MNREQIAEALRQNQVVAYPTEAVFGLGCNPQSESAVKKLLDLKQRPVEKGLILVAPSLDFFRPFVDLSRLMMSSFLACKVNMNVQQLGLCPPNRLSRIFSLANLIASQYVCAIILLWKPYVNSRVLH